MDYRGSAFVRPDGRERQTRPCPSVIRDKDELKRARVMIERCGYWRRKEELEDAEVAAQSW